MKNPNSQSGIVTPRALFAFALCSVGVLLAMFSFAATPSGGPLAPAVASNWSIVATPTITGARTNNEITDIACASASDCWAVGSYDNGTVYQSLIEHWDGSAWTIVASPNTSPTEYNLLNGVTCASSSNCWAVGYYLNTLEKTLVQHWDGTAWTIVTSPNIATRHNILEAVTCASSSDCWAVGYYINDTSYQTLIERWNGTSWTIVSSPNTSSTQYNSLSGVTCVSSTDCWAAGNYHSANAIQTLIEHWDGSTWTIVTSANVSPIQNEALSGVTCVSATDCWAVGNYGQGAAIHLTLTEHWDGTSWSIVPSPNTPKEVNYLRGVTCLSASDCWASGYSNFMDPPRNSYEESLIEHWDGVSWTMVASPNTSATENNRLLGVTCALASNCWAFGYSYPGNTPQTLIERWDGSAWAIETSPNANASQSNNLLEGVTCVSASDCWAVGLYRAGETNQTLIEHWNGTDWTIVTSPNTSSTQSNRLTGVVCASAANCWAVGSYEKGIVGLDGVYQSLIERWNGTSWAIVSSPNSSTTQHNELKGVTCVSASNCWAVGYYINDITSTYQTLIERWDGTSWSIVTPPNTNTIGSRYTPHAIEVVMFRSAGVGRGDDDPRGPIPVFDEGLIGGTIIVDADGEAVRSRHACHAKQNIVPHSAGVGRGDDGP